jgi:predicted nuclease of restriction endonuclease-like RecB superfamily
VKKLRNKFEQKINAQLKRLKVKFEYESERILCVLASYYLPDFVLNTDSGKIYIETKGYLRPESKRKLVAVKKQHPELDIRIVFYASNKKYIAWADRNGFRWAVGRIPKEWLT